MDEYPDASRMSKPQATAPPEKKVEKVVTGEVKFQKKPMGARFTERFLGGDLKTVMKHFYEELFLPNAKDFVLDQLNTGAQRLMFRGEVPYPTRGVGTRTGFASPYGLASGAYQAYATMGTPVAASNAPMPTGARPPGMGRAEQVVLSSRAEAHEILDRLRGYVETYEMATVSDLYTMLGQPSDFIYDNFGWTDLSGAGVMRGMQGGFVLNLPPAKPLR